MIYDTDSNGFGGPGDMNGPGIGEVAYRQAPDSSLQLDVRLEFAQLVTTYEAFLVCGAAHSLACGFVSAGTVTTDAVGAGSGTLTVPAGVLLAAPFGPGYRSDHLDLLQGAGDVSRGLLTAGALNYLVCRRRPVAGAAEREPEPVEAARASLSPGQRDPAGAMIDDRDPAGGRPEHT
ncbi:MAG TPA: hypothetical protein VI006_12235 [Solirubrobacteraceae bacterium]